MLRVLLKELAVPWASLSTERLVIKWQKAADPCKSDHTKERKENSVATLEADFTHTSRPGVGRGPNFSLKIPSHITIRVRNFNGPNKESIL